MLNLAVDKIFKCQYCNSKFSQERTLSVHMCEPKRRHLAKDDKSTVIAFQTYNKFYQVTQNLNGNKTFDEFAKSPYYNAFVKFGSFVSNVNPLYPDKFIEYIVTSGVKLDHWCRDELYDKYVINLIHTEAVETALERSIKYMELWAKENNSLWNHYFTYANTNRATFDIKDGKISPWLLLNSTSGKNMLQSFRDDQLAAISSIIDPNVWVKKFKKQTFDLDLVKQVVREANL